MREFFSLLAHYQQEKLTKALSTVTYSELDDYCKYLWHEQSREIEFVCYLMSWDSQNLSNWIYQHREEMEFSSPFIAVYSPQTAVYMLHHDKPVNLLRDGHWDVSIYVLETFLEYDKTVAETILKNNISIIAEETSSLSHLDYESIEDFFEFLLNKFPNSLLKIYDAIDLNMAKNKWLISVDQINGMYDQEEKLGCQKFMDFIYDTSPIQTLKDLSRDVSRRLQKRFKLNKE